MGREGFNLQYLNIEKMQNENRQFGAGLECAEDEARRQRARSATAFDKISQQVVRIFGGGYKVPAKAWRQWGET